MKSEYTVFIADDHALVRESLILLIEKDPKFRVVGEAGTGPETLAQCTQLSPDIAVIDISMPGISGLDVIEEMKNRQIATKAVMISFQALPEQIVRAAQNGALGFVQKDASGRELLSALNAVIHNRNYFSQGIAAVLLHELMEGNTRGPKPAGPDLRILSLREREVLQMVAEGKKNSTVAAELNLSIKTIDTYRSRIMQKLNLHSLAELVRFAVKTGLVDQNS